MNLTMVISYSIEQMYLTMIKLRMLEDLLHRIIQKKIYIMNQ